VLYRDVVRLVYLLQQAAAIRALRLPQGLPLRRAVPAHRVCLYHARTVKQMRLTRALLYLPVPHDRLCRADQA
jgi:hypothetical protein